MQSVLKASPRDADEATQLLPGMVPGWQFETTDLETMPTEVLSIETAEFFDPGIPAALPVSVRAHLPASLPAADQITEEEFEQWLDALHGPGAAPRAPADMEEATLLISPSQAASESGHDEVLGQAADLALELIGMRNELRDLIGPAAAPELSRAIGRLDALTRMLWQTLGPAAPAPDTSGKHVADLLSVRIGAHAFALPLSVINTVESMNADRIRMVAGRRMMAHASGVMPVVDSAFLSMTLGDPTCSKMHKCVFLELDGARRVLLVDEVIGREQALIKPLPSSLGQGPWCSGAVIRGDGGMTLVLNPDVL